MYTMTESVQKMELLKVDLKGRWMGHDLQKKCFTAIHSVYYVSSQYMYLFPIWSIDDL